MVSHNNNELRELLIRLGFQPRRDRRGWWQLIQHEPAEESFCITIKVPTREIAVSGTCRGYVAGYRIAGQIRPYLMPQRPRGLDSTLAAAKGAV